MIFTTACTIIPKLDSNACDCLLIVLLHDLYHETACHEHLAKILLCNISSCAPPTFRIAYMCDMPIQRKYFVFQLNLFSMRSLDYFSLAVLNNYSVCLLCSVSSVLSIFLVINNSSKICRVMVQMSSKSALRNLAI